MAKSTALGKREFSTLRDAVVFGWDIERDGYGRLLWDGDYLMPFRATATLNSLIAKGLMELVCGRTYRATLKAREYKCACSSGKTYASEDSDEIIDCPACGGKGMLTSPREIRPAAPRVNPRSTKRAKPISEQEVPGHG